MRFGAFNKYKEVLEITKQLSFEDFELNEAFDSSYLRKFAAQNQGRWSGNFAKDFYKHAGIKLDKITNEDFVILSNPSEWWTQGYAKNNQAIGFFVDDNPELFKYWKKSQRGKLSKDAQGVGLVLTIMRGKVGMWFGFGQDPGSSYSRHRKSNSERYGVLADEYDTRAKYGYDNPNQPPAKITRKNLEEYATKVYVLNMEALKSKYSTEELKVARAAAKSGAAAFMTNDQVKKDNRSRYDAAMQAGLTPDALFKDLKSTLSSYMNWFQNQLDQTDLKDAKDFADHDKISRWGGSWSADISRPISDMIRKMQEFGRDYKDAMMDLARSQKYAEKLADADDQEKIRIQAEIDYYGKSWDRYVKKAAVSRDEILRFQKDVEKLVS